MTWAQLDQRRQEGEGEQGVRDDVGRHLGDRATPGGGYRLPGCPGQVAQAEGEALVQPEPLRTSAEQGAGWREKRPERGSRARPGAVPEAQLGQVPGPRMLSR
jgi:hypothetical protein